ncbi:FAD-dependent oxidoreductase [Muricoccus vinaceus]|uniref:FAD-dependent oxidoreductase n=1 Tax=Muricoccus vinaceus TaxID=424704 RepID=A0ABV6IQ01_9PROT
MKATPRWLGTTAPFEEAEAGPVEGSVDLAVIGGGRTGPFAALAQGGASGAVLETGKVVGQTSDRNGGHVNNGSAHILSALTDSLGRDHARRIDRAVEDAVDTVERIAREENIACDVRRSGKIRLAAKPDHYEEIARGFGLLRCEPGPESSARSRPSPGNRRCRPAARSPSCPGRPPGSAGTPSVSAPAVPGGQYEPHP